MTQRFSAVLHGGVAQVLFLLVLILGFGVAGASAQTTTEIQIAPGTAAVSSDVTIPFTVHAILSDGSTKDVTAEATFSENDPFGALSGNVYFPGMVGTWSVQAVYRGFSVQASITVTEGTLAEIIINPNTNPEVIRMGGTRAFSAEGFDMDNNPLPGIDPVWAVQGGLGTISEDGVFTPTKIGEGTITASIGDVTQTVRVEVKDIAAESQPANTNTSTGTGTNTNATGAGNTNQTGEVLGEEIAQTNTNTATNENENVNAAAPSEETTTEECSTYAWWIWWIGILAYLGLLVAYYFFVQRRNDLTVWLVPIVLTGGALWAFFALTCSGHFLWVPWVVVIGGLLVTLFRPREFMPTNGKEL